MIHRTLFLLFIVALPLAACGQKGDLYLPAPTESPASAEQTPEEADDEAGTDGDEE